MAIQLLDQSPVNFDEIIMRDLLASYAQQLGNQVLSSSGASGQLLGLRNVTGVETVTWTSATPTAVEFQRRVADAVSRIAGALYAPPTAIVMHPRRWAWLLTQNDTSNRPLVVRSPTARPTPPGSSPGLLRAVWAASPACRCTWTATSPTNLGAGTNQVVVMVLAAADSYLYKSAIRTRVLQETLSGTLTVRIQLYGYVAMATRQPKSLAVISGTGLVAPSFA